jgi:hypothetical protein
VANTSIIRVLGRRVWDSRGRPTVEVHVELKGGARGRAIAPAGASTGTGEAVDLRDGGPRFGGLDVRRAVASVNDIIAPALQGQDALGQSPEHGLAKLSHQRMAAILAGPGIGETLSGNLRQSKRIVDFAKGEQTSIGRHSRAVELQLQTGIKGDPESGFAFFTRRPVHVWLHSHQLSLWSVEQNRVRASLTNVRIWGMRVKSWMGATHFLTRGLNNVRTEISLQVLAYNLKRVMTIIGIAPMMAAITAG